MNPDYGPDPQELEAYSFTLKHDQPLSSNGAENADGYGEVVSVSTTDGSGGNGTADHGSAAGTESGVNNGSLNGSVMPDATENGSAPEAGENQPELDRIWEGGARERMIRLADDARALSLNGFIPDDDQKVALANVDLLSKLAGDEAGLKDALNEQLKVQGQAVPDLSEINDASVTAALDFMAADITEIREAVEAMPKAEVGAKKSPELEEAGEKLWQAVAGVKYEPAYNRIFNDLDAADHLKGLLSAFEGNKNGDEALDELIQKTSGWNDTADAQLKQELDAALADFNQKMEAERKRQPAAVEAKPTVAEVNKLIDIIGKAKDLKALGLDTFIPSTPQLQEDVKKTKLYAALDQSNIQARTVAENLRQVRIDDVKNHGGALTSDMLYQWVMDQCLQVDEQLERVRLAIEEQKKQQTMPEAEPTSDERDEFIRLGAMAQKLELHKIAPDAAGLQLDDYQKVEWLAKVSKTVDGVESSIRDWRNQCIENARKNGRPLSADRLSQLVAGELQRRAEQLERVQKAIEAQEKAGDIKLSPELTDKVNRFWQVATDAKRDGFLDDIVDNLGAGDDNLRQYIQVLGGWSDVKEARTALENSVKAGTWNDSEDQRIQHELDNALPKLEKRVQEARALKPKLLGARAEADYLIAALDRADRVSLDIGAAVAGTLPLDEKQRFEVFLKQRDPVAAFTEFLQKHKAEVLLNPDGWLKDWLSRMNAEVNNATAEAKKAPDIEPRLEEAVQGLWEELKKVKSPSVTDLWEKVKDRDDADVSKQLVRLFMDGKSEVVVATAFQEQAQNDGAPDPGLEAMTKVANAGLELDALYQQLLNEKAKLEGFSQIEKDRADDLWKRIEKLRTNTVAIDEVRAILNSSPEGDSHFDSFLKHGDGVDSLSEIGNSYRGSDPSKRVEWARDRMAAIENAVNTVEAKVGNEHYKQEVERLADPFYHSIERLQIDVLYDDVLTEAARAMADLDVVMGFFSSSANWEDSIQKYADHYHKTWPDDAQEILPGLEAAIREIQQIEHDIRNRPVAPAGGGPSTAPGGTGGGPGPNPAAGGGPGGTGRPAPSLFGKEPKLNGKKIENNQLLADPEWLARWEGEELANVLERVKNKDLPADSPLQSIKLMLSPGKNRDAFWQLIDERVPSPGLKDRIRKMREKVDQHEGETIEQALERAKWPGRLAAVEALQQQLEDLNVALGPKYKPRLETVEQYQRRIEGENKETQEQQVEKARNDQKVLMYELPELWDQVKGSFEGWNKLTLLQSLPGIQGYLAQGPTGMRRYIDEARSRYETYNQGETNQQGQIVKETKPDHLKMNQAMIEANIVNELRSIHQAMMDELAKNGSGWAGKFRFMSELNGRAAGKLTPRFGESEQLITGPQPNGVEITKQDRYIDASDTRPASQAARQTILQNVSGALHRAQAAQVIDELYRADNGLYNQGRDKNKQNLSAQKVQQLLDEKGFSRDQFERIMARDKAARDLGRAGRTMDKVEQIGRFRLGKNLLVDAIRTADNHVLFGLANINFESRPQDKFVVENGRMVRTNMVEIDGSKIVNDGLGWPVEVMFKARAYNDDAGPQMAYRIRQDTHGGWLLESAGKDAAGHAIRMKLTDEEMKGLRIRPKEQVELRPIELTGWQQIGQAERGEQAPRSDGVARPNARSVLSSLGTATNVEMVMANSQDLAKKRPMRRALQKLRVMGTPEMVYPHSGDIAQNVNWLAMKDLANGPGNYESNAAKAFYDQRGGRLKRAGRFAGNAGKGAKRRLLG